MFTLHSLFFFSSRRRHTRSLCDWSSDVCSSDLKQKTAYEITRLNSSHTVISYAVFCLKTKEHTASLYYESDAAWRALLAIASITEEGTCSRIMSTTFIALGVEHI